MQIFIFYLLAQLLVTVTNGVLDNPIHMVESNKAGICRMKLQFYEYFVYKCSGKPVQIFIETKLEIGKNAKLAKSFQLENPTILLDPKFDLNRAYSLDRASRKAYEQAMATGAFLEDLKGFWILAIFPAIGANCSETRTTQSTSSAPTTTPTTTTPPKPTPVWVRVIVAEIREFNSSSSSPNVPQQLDYAVRVGFINTAEAEEKIADVHMKQKIEELSRWAIEFGGKHGLANETQKWLAKNQWIVDIKQGHFQYAPVSGEELDLAGNGGQAMMQLHRCNIGHFLVAPAKLNATLVINHTEPLADWSEDFHPFEHCNFFQYDLITQRLPRQRNSYMDKETYAAYFRMDIGYEITNITTLTGPMVLNRGKCEAFKYKFGYDNPLRRPEFNDTFDEYKRVKQLGYYLLPIDAACQPKRQYGLYVNMLTVSLSMFYRRNWATPAPYDEKSENCSVGFCFKCNLKECFFPIHHKLLQPIHECPAFKLWIPRLAGFLEISIEWLNGTKQNISFPNTIEKFSMSLGGSYREVEIRGLKKYKLYEEYNS